MTRPDGRYVLTSMRPGSYALRYTDCADPGRYLDTVVGWGLVAGRCRVSGCCGRPGQELSPRSRCGPCCRRLPRSPRSGTGALAGLTSAELASAGLTRGRARERLSPATPVDGHSGRCHLRASDWRRQAAPGRLRQRLRPRRLWICPHREGRSLPDRPHGSRTIRGSFPQRCPILCQQKRQLAHAVVPRLHDVLQPPRKPTLVRVAAGRTTSGIDAALKLGGEIEGTARSKSGKDTLGRLRRCLPDRQAPSQAGVLLAHSPARAAMAAMPCTRCSLASTWSSSRSVAATEGITRRNGGATPRREARQRRSGSRAARWSGTLMRPCHLARRFPAWSRQSSSGKLLSGICVFAESQTAPFAQRGDSQERQLQAHRHGHGQLPDLLFRGAATGGTTLGRPGR